MFLRLCCNEQSESKVLTTKALYVCNRVGRKRKLPQRSWRLCSRLGNFESVLMLGPNLVASWNFYPATIHSQKQEIGSNARSFTLVHPGPQKVELLCGRPWELLHGPLPQKGFLLAPAQCLGCCKIHERANNMIEAWHLWCQTFIFGSCRQPLSQNHRACKSWTNTLDGQHLTRLQAAYLVLRVSLDLQDGPSSFSSFASSSWELLGKRSSRSRRAKSAASSRIAASLSSCATVSKESWLKRVKKRYNEFRSIIATSSSCADFLFSSERAGLRKVVNLVPPTSLWLGAALLPVGVFLQCLLAPRAACNWWWEASKAKAER